MNNKFPPYLNNNYKDIDPITGFDFKVLLNDEKFTQIAKFERLDFSFDGFSLFNWTLQQGIIEPDYQTFFMDLKTPLYHSFKGPSFIIEYNERKSESYTTKCRLYNSNKISLSLGVMPGRRLAVINMKGTSNKFESGVI